MTNCPACHQPLRCSSGGGGLSANLPEGSVVYACMSCRKFTVEGSGRWVGAGTPGGADLLESLRVLATAAKQNRDAYKAMMESPIEDPRWEMIS